MRLKLEATVICLLVLIIARAAEAMARGADLSAKTYGFVWLGLARCLRWRLRGDDGVIFTVSPSAGPCWRRIVTRDRVFFVYGDAA